MKVLISLDRVERPFYPRQQPLGAPQRRVRYSSVSRQKLLVRPTISRSFPLTSTRYTRLEVQHAGRTFHLTLQRCTGINSDELGYTVWLHLDPHLPPQDEETAIERGLQAIEGIVLGAS